MKNQTILMQSLAMDGTFTARQASSLLREYEHFRTLWEKLCRYTDSPETLRFILTDGLAANHPDMARSSIDRNVRNWMNDRTAQTIARRTAIEICFILGLDLDTADELLASLTEERFRWRDPHECALAFALARSMSYPEACELEKRAAQAAAAGGEAKSQSARTQDVRNALLLCETAEDMLAYVAANAERFGKHRNTAFALFDRMLSLLEQPGGDALAQNVPNERKMTIREVLRVYLHRDLVPASKKKKAADGEQALTKAQQAVITQIRASWPDESTLSRNRSHTEDVSRKALILLFLATDGGGSGEDDDLSNEDDWEPEPEELSRERLFEDSLMRLNLMLISCGYRTIDPRNAFDWMVLYALNVDAAYETDERLNDLLRHLFPPQNP